MKRLFLLYFLLILFSAETNAQLKGYFCDSRTFSSSCINILNETEFEYDYSDCTSFRKGAGTYQLNRKELVLNFNKYKPELPVNSVKIKTAENKKDSVTFNVFVFDKKFSEPLVFASIILKNKEEKIIGGQSGDISGKIKFTFPKSSDTVSLVIPYIGYQSCLIPIVLDKNYNIEAGLVTGPVEWIEPGKTWKWKIKALSATGFKTKGKNEMIFKRND